MLRSREIVNAFRMPIREFRVGIFHIVTDRDDPGRTRCRLHILPIGPHQETKPPTMFLTPWLTTLKLALKSSRPFLRRPARRLRRRGLRTTADAAEMLEDRILLASFNVTSMLDAPDEDPGDGISDDGMGNSTLRSAIMEANALAGDDVITLGAGTFTLSINGTGEDAAAMGDLDITENVTIMGAGAGMTTIDANNIDRVFHVLNNANVMLIGVTVTGGQIAGDNGGGGAAIAATPCHCH